MATFTDDFNRANSNTVGGGWSETEVGVDDAIISSNKLLFNDPGNGATVYRTRTVGYGRNNTTAQFKINWEAGVAPNNWLFSISGDGLSRSSAGVASHRIHITIDATKVYFYDGVTLKSSMLHGLSFAVATDYYVRWDIEADYSMRVYIGTTSFSFPTLAELVATQVAFTPSGTDLGAWSFEGGGGGGSSQVSFNDLTIYDSVQAAPTYAPSVTTSAVSSIGLRGATGNGNVTADSGYVITERGICWNTSTLPTIANNKVTASGTIGAFTGAMTGLSVNTHYYVRAYATNSQGTSYGAEVEFDTLNIASTDFSKDIGAVVGDTYAVRMVVTGTTGTVTVKLGTTGATAVFTAGGGAQVMQGIYAGTDGIIITRSTSPAFNGTVDNVQWVRVEGTGTIDWSLATFTTLFPIESEVLFKRIEDEVFNDFRFYRFLDLLFKDLDGYVTVTLKQEASDAVTSKTKTFIVGNTSSPASPFSKKRISFLSKNQALIIGLSNASFSETFAIAQFLLEGDKKSKKMFSSGKIISVS